MEKEDVEEEKEKKDEEEETEDGRGCRLFTSNDVEEKVLRNELLDLEGINFIHQSTSG